MAAKIHRATLQQSKAHRSQAVSSCSVAPACGMRDARAKDMCTFKGVNASLDQIGRSFCLFGKSRLFAVGGGFSLPGSVFLTSSSVQKMAAGNRRN